jgi:diguanylate cyclase (GGDEF)-like protein
MTGVAAVLAIALVAVAIRILILQRQLRALAGQAVTDPLTGAFNRRQLDVSLAAAMERCRRTGEPVSLLMLDVDRFKEINDAVGHSGGDRVLKGLVPLVAQRARKVDALFRIGGEEFALLLAGATFPDAWRIAEQLRARVAAATLIDGRRVSISIGVSEWSPEDSADAWMHDADAALYHAKRGGRNRVAGTPPHRSPRAAMGRFDQLRARRKDFEERRPRGVEV